MLLGDIKNNLPKEAISSTLCTETSVFQMFWFRKHRASLLSHSLLTAGGWDHQVAHHILPTEPLLRVLPGRLDFRQKANPPWVSTPFSPVLSACETTQEPHVVCGFCFCFMIYLFVAVLGLHCCVWAFSRCCELLTSFSAQASHCRDLFCFRAQALGTLAPAVVACGLSSCGSQL